MKLYKVDNDVYVLEFISLGGTILASFFGVCFSIIFFQNLVLEPNIVSSNNEIFGPLIGIFFSIFAAIVFFETGYYRFDLPNKTVSWKTIRLMRRKYGEINLESGTKVMLKGGFGSRSNNFNLILFNEQNGLNMSLNHGTSPQLNKQLKSIACELNKLLE